MKPSLHIVIMAAGQGTRMQSSLPKVLHTLGNKSLLLHVIDTATMLNPAKIHVVIGHQAELIRKTINTESINFVIQAQQLGTGHAVKQALLAIPQDSDVLILSGDVPLIQAETLQALLTQYKENHLTKLGLIVNLADNPEGLGRILRNSQEQILSIVEEKDATQEQRKIHEVYAGICCAQASDLNRWLAMINSNNAQSEQYLTDIIALAANENHSIVAFQAPKLDVQGVNNRWQLQQLERAWQTRMAQQFILSGVKIADATRFDLRGNLHCGKDVFIDINVIIEGNVIIGDGCTIGANCNLNNVTIAANSTILPQSILESCTIGANCQIGPFARLRPGSILGDQCIIGNFVETKNITLDQGSKARHLSYLGDATIGKNVNIGAGTITCNYDGANKHQTIIGDGVFIGSDTQLVAPISIGNNATIGAGSTIRRTVPADELTLTISTQKTILGWRRPKKIEVDS